MTTLELLAALAVAVRRNDTRATARLLDELEASMAPEEVIELLEAIAGDVPEPAAQAVVACA